MRRGTLAAGPLTAHPLSGGNTGGMPSEASDALKSVVLSAAPTLTAAGFTKRRNAFNRTTEPGVVQVLSFTLEKASGTRTAATSSGRRFNVNLGVYLLDGEVSTPAWV